MVVPSRQNAVKVVLTDINKISVRTFCIYCPIWAKIGISEPKKNCCSEFMSTVKLGSWKVAGAE
jgi:hypothetical protein